MTNTKDGEQSMSLQGEELKLVPPSHPFLCEPLPKFDFTNPPINPVELYNILGNKLIEFDGIGLAANQIGLPYNCFVIRSDPVLAFFNAKIVDTSEEMLDLEEGCLTYPGLVLKIKRPRAIRVRFTDPLGETNTKKFQDMTARVIQHEMDHMQGLTFGHHVSRLQLEMAINKASKLGRHYLIGDLV
jgi:peptide deformylase